jgi:DNA-binding NarL/FixJ family response regulator
MLATTRAIHPGEAVLNTVRVLVIEDDHPTRERLGEIIEQADGLELAGCAADCAAARAELARTPPPQVMLVDLGLPDGSGIDLIRESRRLPEPPEAMVISVFGDERHVVNAIEAGATGYLLKDASAERIVASIADLLQGGSPISAGIARHLLRRFQQPPAAASGVEDLPELTPREMEVLLLVGKGFSYAEIAATLGVSAHTVTSHIKHIYRKLEVRSRGEAVFEAMQRGLLRI